jgi:hypothetical protein
MRATPQQQQQMHEILHRIHQQEQQDSSYSSESESEAFALSNEQTHTLASSATEALGADQTVTDWAEARDEEEEEGDDAGLQYEQWLASAAAAAGLSMSSLERLLEKVRPGVVWGPWSW